MSNPTVSRTGELVSFALERLPSMRLPDGVFCHEVVLAGERRSGGRLGRGPRVPAGEGTQAFGRSLRYTLMVLIGAQRAREADLALSFDPGPSRRALLEAAESLCGSVGDAGLLLWADARCGLGARQAAVEGLRHALDAPDADTAEGHELAWAVIGCAEAVLAGGSGEAEALFETFSRRLVERSGTSSGLLAHAGAGPRARFPHFATQIYGVLALTRAAVVARRTEHLAAARGVADRLLDQQRERGGGWPWLFDAHTGRVVEPYRLYSAHQDAMAPMALLPLADSCGDERYRDAAIRGLAWIWGDNELAAPMLDREAAMLFRSINRKGARDRLVLWANTALARAGGRPLGRRAAKLEIERTDRPYHLGWVLEAWAGASS